MCVVGKHILREGAEVGGAGVRPQKDLLPQSKPLDSVLRERFPAGQHPAHLHSASLSILLFKWMHTMALLGTP